MSLLRLDRVTFGHPGGRRVLTDATLDLPHGTRTALLGANGAGKSTLLRTLVGLLEPTSGAVVVDDTPLTYGRAAVRAHRRRVQLVLQDPDDQLFSADVYQDISYGPTNMDLPVDEIRARVSEAMGLLGVEHLADRPTHQLSYGERKRVATAGAVAMRPDVLLLDEPTAGLDPRGVDEVTAALARLHTNGTTLLVATHDVEFALAWADSVAVVVDGGVVQGSPVDILGDAALIERAHLRMPWPLWVAREMGVDASPRTFADVVQGVSRA